MYWNHHEWWILPVWALILVTGTLKKAESPWRSHTKSLHLSFPQEKAFLFLLLCDCGSYYVHLTCASLPIPCSQAPGEQRTPCWGLCLCCLLLSLVACENSVLSVLFLQGPRSVFDSLYPNTTVFLLFLLTFNLLLDLPIHGNISSLVYLASQWGRQFPEQLLQ